MLWSGWLAQKSSADTFVKMLDARYHLKDTWAEDCRVHVYAMTREDQMRLMILNTSEDTFETTVHLYGRSRPLHCTPNMAEFLNFDSNATTLR